MKIWKRKLVEMSLCDPCTLAIRQGGKMKNPISPYSLTPDGIREYQKNEPYPDRQFVYELQLTKIAEEKMKFLNTYLGCEEFTKSISFEEFLKSEARHTANWYVHRGTMLSWSTLRKLVWIRDEGICDICKIEITLTFPRFSGHK
jgi:hypothetical protein